LTRSWHDLYWHGEGLSTLCKKFYTEFRNAEERGDEEAMRMWGEALRKVTMNCVDIAKTVLGVEEIVKGKRVFS